MRHDANPLKIADQHDLELDDDEITGKNDFPYKMGPHVCGAIVDKRSAKGKVVITGGENSKSRVIQTGPEKTGNQFAVVEIAEDETCMIYGKSTILYIKPRQS